MLDFSLKEKGYPIILARKTCISRLLDADILENFVAQSRKSLQGAGFYNLISNQQVINTKREGL